MVDSRGFYACPRDIFGLHVHGKKKKNFFFFDGGRDGFLCGPVTTCQKILGFFFFFFFPCTCKPKKGSTREDFTHVHEKFTHVHEKFFGFNVHGEKKYGAERPQRLEFSGVALRHIFEPYIRIH